jgi:hypothetical protein
MGTQYAIPGVGTKNKAEALYLLKGHEPRHRKYKDEEIEEAPVSEYGQDIHSTADQLGKDPSWTAKWTASTKNVAERFPDAPGHRDMEMEVRFGSFIPGRGKSNEEALTGINDLGSDCPGYFAINQRPPANEKIEGDINSRKCSWPYLEGEHLHGERSPPRSSRPSGFLEADESAHQQIKK